MSDGRTRTLDLITALEARLRTDPVVISEAGGRIKARSTAQEVVQPGLYWTITSSLLGEVFEDVTLMWELWTRDRAGMSAVRGGLLLEDAVRRVMHRDLPVTLELPDDGEITVWSQLEVAYDADPADPVWARKILRFRYQMTRVRPLTPEV